MVMVIRLAKKSKCFFVFCSFAGPVRNLDVGGGVSGACQDTGSQDSRRAQIFGYNGFTRDDNDIGNFGDGAFATFFSEVVPRDSRSGISGDGDRGFVENVGCVVLTFVRIVGETVGRCARRWTEFFHIFVAVFRVFIESIVVYWNDDQTFVRLGGLFVTLLGFRASFGILRLPGFVFHTFRFSRLSGRSRRAQTARETVRLLVQSLDRHYRTFQPRCPPSPFLVDLSCSILAPGEARRGRGSRGWGWGRWQTSEIIVIRLQRTRFLRWLEIRRVSARRQFRKIVYGTGSRQGMIRIIMEVGTHGGARYTGSFEYYRRDWSRWGPYALCHVILRHVPRCSGLL